MALHLVKPLLSQWQMVDLVWYPKCDSDSDLDSSAKKGLSGFQWLVSNYHINIERGQSFGIIASIIFNLVFFFKTHWPLYNGHTKFLEHNHQPLKCQVHHLKQFYFLNIRLPFFTTLAFCKVCWLTPFKHSIILISNI